jgi:CheY-like chemotaxis protein
VRAALRARQRQYELRAQLQAQAAAEQALRDADKRKDEFLATLAHELRNPLAPLRTGLQLIGGTALDEARVQRVRQMMDRQVTQLVKLIDDLLEVSRISTGKVVLQTERIDMRRVVEAALESSQPAILASQHTLRIDLPQAPVWVEGDPSRLEQVICNLVNNACKYTPRGGNIRVSLTQVSGQATLQVIDNGLGIPQEMLPAVFEMFTQVDRNLDRAQGGLGIGLSLVRRLMELHGGEVRADSPGPNHGSTFTVVLPLIDPDAPIASEQVAAGARTAARPLRVLVVDDNRDAADALSMLLATHGHETRIAYGGAAALEIAEEFQPETVFCDLGMPGMNGFEVATRLRRDRNRATPMLVALTGWGTDEDKRKTREGGFDFHVTKPITFEDVDRILSHVRDDAPRTLRQSPSFVSQRLPSR